MSWTVQYKDTLSIVEIVIAGSVTGQDLRESTSRAIALSKEHGVTRFLIDAKGLEVGASVLDLYELPARQYDEEELDRRSRAALVLPKQPKARENAKFYETACVNRGWIVEPFEEADEAVEWLTR